MFTAQHERLEFNMREFIRAGLETGITFASLALDSRTDEKRQRTRENARKAYDTALHFWTDRAFGKLPAPHDLLARRATLRHLLLQLGETLEK